MECACRALGGAGGQALGGNGSRGSQCTQWGAGQGRSKDPSRGWATGPGISLWSSCLLGSQSVASLSAVPVKCLQISNTALSHSRPALGGLPQSPVCLWPHLASSLSSHCSQDCPEPMATPWLLCLKPKPSPHWGRGPHAPRGLTGRAATSPAPPALARPPPPAHAGPSLLLLCS